MEQPISQQHKRIFLLGFMGAGKTYWGKQLAEHLHLPFFDIDEVIVEEEGMPVSDIFAEKGEDYFRNRESEVLKRISQEEDEFLISCGGGTPCFLDNMDWMNDQGTTVWLNPSIPTMVERLQRKKYKRPLIQDLSDEDLSAFVEKKLLERAPFYQLSQRVITLDELSLEILTNEIHHA
ncbi:shikimate kinase [Chitinophaga skermanii]|uniref:Shikimate kinase n=1 Tax=Chitinophaga skermanii TaxID=331697 RepID=A0A327QKK9_9BACT|nr:shikimate kinase [Chitinophaga skermanii]RAJ02297.1 shikimate kinase [Chitinophaga skermanii]